jgi:adenine-specific DNA-methyltransferase
VPKADKKLVLKPAIFDVNGNKHRVFNESANILIKRITGDILYLDPPYTSRQYGGDYHLLNTVARYDDFVPNGKTGRREYQRSAWASRRHVEKAFDDLIRNAQFKYIFMSYNNEGIMSPEAIEQSMSKYGHYDRVKTEHKRFKSSQGEHKANRTVEYVHILEKR